MRIANGYRRAWPWLGVALAGCGAAFALPFCMPAGQPVFSAAWMAGADNRAAVAGVVAISLAVLLWRWRISAPQPQDASTRALSCWWLWAALALTLAWTAVLGALVLRAHAFWGDEGYFVTQLRTGLLFHRQLYR